MGGFMHPGYRREQQLPGPVRARLRLRAGAGAVYGYNVGRKEEGSSRCGPEERPVLGPRPRYRRRCVGDADRPGGNGWWAAVGLGHRRQADLHGERKQ